MLDLNVIRKIKDLDFLLMPALEIRKYEWASLKVYNEYVNSRMNEYSTKYDLINWLQFWTEEWRLSSPFESNTLYKKLIKISRKGHDKILKRIYSTYKNSTNVHNGYDIWNSIDAFIILDQIDNINNIFDFGGGYGRLGIVFHENEKVKNYICVDCVELSYMLQNITLSALDPYNFYDYIEFEFEKKPFNINLKDNNGLYHLPTWKWKLINDNSLDLITSVFVLPEINEFALYDFISQAIRTLKPGGHLYIRDHLYTTGKNSHLCAHKLNTEDLLNKNNFKLIYKGDYEDNKNIYGIPRIYKLEK